MHAWKRDKQKFPRLKCRSIYTANSCGTSTWISTRLAQWVEHETLNFGVVGLSPKLGDCFFFLQALSKESLQYRQDQGLEPHSDNLIP